jgi:nucleotide-binding universal stress UspA family protein
MSASGSRHSPVVVVGFDESPGALSALAYAVARAKRRGQIVVVQASPDPLALPTAARALVERLPLPYGMRCSPVVRAGSPASVLAEVATEFDADEIAVGRHGSDGRRQGLGTVPPALLGQTERPVVVVPTAAS